MGKVKNHLFDEWEAHLHYQSVGHNPGWYYSDETADLCGPFPTKAEAKTALIKYAETLR